MDATDAHINGIKSSFIELNDYPIVLIEWADSATLSKDKWINLNQIEEPYEHLCLSVG
jgi:hypothetical protein